MKRFLFLFLFVVSLSIHAQDFDVLTLRLNIILLQKNDGSGNFNKNDSLHMDFFQKSVEKLNEFYAFDHRQEMDSICEEKSKYRDTGIRFRLNEVLEIRDDYYWNNDNDKNWCMCPSRTNWYLLPLQKKLDSVTSKEEKALNIYLSVSECNYNDIILKGDSCEKKLSKVACSMFPSKDSTTFSLYHSPNAFIKYEQMNAHPYYWSYGTFARTMAHELGHNLGLTHVKTCDNIMNGGGSVNNRVLTDVQVEKARQNILKSNLKQYLDSF
jgi:hypothetical protein